MESLQNCDTYDLFIVKNYDGSGRAKFERAHQLINESATAIIKFLRMHGFRFFLPPGTVLPINPKDEEWAGMVKIEPCNTGAEERIASEEGGQPKKRRR